MLLRHGGTEPQMEFWNSDARFRAFVGGVGSGKTRAGVVDLLRFPSGSRITCAAPTYRMLEDATIQTFKEVCGSFFRPEDFKKSDNKCTLANGTEILFRSCDEPDKLRGPNLSAFWLDEAAMMPEVVWDLMIGRLRLLPGKGIITTTPRGKNWLYKLFCRDQANNPDYHLVQCSSRTNTFLPSYFIKSLEAKYSGHWLKQELEGAFVEFIDAMAYEDFKTPINVLDEKFETEDLYDPRIPLKLACDFNNRIMAWQVVQVIGDQPTVIAEISQLGEANVEKMVRKFRTKFPVHSAGLEIYGDASGNHGSAAGSRIYDLMGRYFAGYRSDPEWCIPKSNPSVIDRVHTVNEILRGRRDPDNPMTRIWQPLAIVASAEYLIEDFQRVQWNDRGDKILKIEDPKDDRSLLTHATDGLGYWAMMDVPSGPQLTPAELEHQRRMETIFNTRRTPNHGQGLRGI